MQKCGEKRVERDEKLERWAVLNGLHLEICIATLWVAQDSATKNNDTFPFGAQKLAPKYNIHEISYYYIALSI